MASFVFLLLSGWPSTAAQTDYRARARRLLREVPLIDGHNDLPWQIRQHAGGEVARLDLRRPQPDLHTDIPRLRAGGVGAQFWSVYVPASLGGDEAVRTTLEQIDVVHQLVARYPDVFALARTADDVVRLHRAGKIACLMGAEGGHSIHGSLGVLRMFYRLGVRYMTLTHSRNTPWADSATDEARVGGLSPFGEKVVREMNRLGMLVDLSHVAVPTMEDALRVTRAPVIFSHSSARALCDTPRNVPDAILRRLRANGGVCMVTFVGAFVNEEVRRWGKALQEERERLRQLHPGDPAKARELLAAWRRAHPAPRATLQEVADHIDHIRTVAGIDHVGVGSDFDGFRATPVGLEDVSKFVDLMAELLRRGYTPEEVKKVAGLNVLRVMRAVEAKARELQQTAG